MITSSGATHTETIIRPKKYGDKNDLLATCWALPKNAMNESDIAEIKQDKSLVQEEKNKANNNDRSLDQLFKQQMSISCINSDSSEHQPMQSLNVKSIIDMNDNNVCQFELKTANAVDHISSKCGNASSSNQETNIRMTAVDVETDESQTNADFYLSKKSIYQKINIQMTAADVGTNVPQTDMNTTGSSCNESFNGFLTCHIPYNTIDLSFSLNHLFYTDVSNKYIHRTFFSRMQDKIIYILIHYKSSTCIHS